MRIVSWNVNGIRSVLNKGFFTNFINNIKADVIHLQEAKIDDKTFEQIDLQSKIPKNFNIYTHFATRKKGYSGLITITKNKPLKVVGGIGQKEFDEEGRLILLEYSDYLLLNIYFPNSSRDLSRLDFKEKFNVSLLSKIREIKKPLILSGDFNVAHTPKDIARARQNEGNAGYTSQERKFFDNLLDAGFVDTFRYLNPSGIKYSWWLQSFSAREKNIGWRIDYNLVSKSMVKNVVRADVLTEVYGSDHCPILLDINFPEYIIR